LRQTIRQFLGYCEKERAFSPHTVRAYANDLLGFALWMETTLGTATLDRAQTLTPADLRSYWASRRQGGMSSASMRRAQSSLRGLFRYAVQRGLATTDPTKAMETPRSIRALHEVLSEAMCRRF